MTEAEMLKMIRQIAGIRPPAGKQEATQPDSVIAENYARVVAEVMRRDGIELNGVDMRDIRPGYSSYWPTVAACRCTGRARKRLTSGRSRSGYGGNQLIKRLLNFEEGSWWLAECKFTFW